MTSDAGRVDRLSRQRAMVLQPASPGVWRAMSEDMGAMAAFRMLREEAVQSLAAWVGDVPSQTPIKVRTVRLYAGAPRFELIEVPLNEDDPDGPTEWLTVELPAWGIQAEGVYDMRAIPEHAGGYERARRHIADASHD